ncbi:MAG: gliding motility-associated C-terminal domain-containing protein [Bacteroidales bacterium]
MQRVTLKFLLILALSMCSFNVFAQLTAPGRDWSGVTSYVVNEKPDSIFTFFASSGVLNCKHTTGHTSTFSWYKYNPRISNVANRFELFQTVAGEVSSEISGLEEGGYRVVVVDDTDSTETFTAWLFTDNIVLNRIDVDSRCQFLELVVVTTPSSYNIEYDNFLYYNLSRTTSQPGINTFGKNYFSDIVWTASDSRVEFSQSSWLRQTIEDPAPLYNSSYSVEITNIFGRVMTAQTDEITGIAAKAVQAVQTESEGTWTDYNSSGDNEALLGLRLESSSINADSIYWNLSNLVTVDDEEYVVIWKDSSLFSTRVESFPTKQLMRPGYFKVKHLAYNTISGCKDSVEVEVKVDSSKIDADAIPNVLFPSRGVNFRFIDPTTKLKSIKSFTISIFSRSGRLIYEYSGDPKEWEGWDGKIDGSGGDAAPGVYFFIIEAKGWDDRAFDYGPYKGFLHLFRDK